MWKFLQIRYFALGLLVTVILYLAAIPFKLAIVHRQTPAPQAVLMLGGGDDRERFTAKFALVHPDLEIWVSTGTNPHKAAEIFEAAGVNLSRVHLDYQAVDTVTNFTTMASNFQKLEIKHVYLLTSKFHMRRAKAIAFLVFGSREIVCTLVEIPSERQTESTLHVLRDVGRSLLWLLTGKAGAHLGVSWKIFVK